MTTNTNAAPTAAVTAPDERAAFDAVNLRDYFGGPLSYRERDIAFMAWQARAALALAGPSDAEIAELRQKHGITSDGRGIHEFAKVASFTRAVLARWAAPQPPEARKPLTDEQIEGLPMWRNFVGLWPESRAEITRAIEAAHDITGETT